MIEVNGLTKHFGSVTAVDNLSFTVRPGVVTGFLGPNGAGKSTTMRMILGSGENTDLFAMPLVMAQVHPGGTTWHYHPIVPRMMQGTRFLRGLNDSSAMTGRTVTTHQNTAELEVGYDIPATVGMDENDIQTPCLILDLDALERNIKTMGDFARQMGIRHRVHGKMHKSVDVVRLQEQLGGSTGVCCQKVSEAEAFARGGIKDLLITNQVRDPQKIDRLARLPKLGARTIVCVDDIENVAELSDAAQRHGTMVECLVEIDCGAGRCGVTTTQDVVAIARAIADAAGLKFAGLQAYQGSAQHLSNYSDRKAKIDVAVEMVKSAMAALEADGLECELVSGGGTGSYYFEATSGVYNELQCGSYAFMDADYGRVLDEDGRRLDRGKWENALFILTSVMSHAKSGLAICDAGLKAQSVDSGLPVIYGRTNLKYVKCSDEHGVIEDPEGVLKINDKLRLVPGHCDPTCNVHDWYVGVRNGKVEVLWPITARGKSY